MNALFGQLISAGTMSIDGERVAGLFVAVSESALKGAKSIPLYQSVAILESRMWTHESLSSALLKHGITASDKQVANVIYDLL